METHSMTCHNRLPNGCPICRSFVTLDDPCPCDTPRPFNRAGCLFLLVYALLFGGVVVWAAARCL